MGMERVTGVTSNPLKNFFKKKRVHFGSRSFILLSIFKNKSDVKYKSILSSLSPFTNIQVYCSVLSYCELYHCLSVFDHFVGLALKRLKGVCFLKDVKELSSLIFLVFKCPSSLSARAPSDCPSVWFHWMFYCPLSVFKCMLCGLMSDHIWLEQNAMNKVIFSVYEQSQNGRKDFEELHFEAKSECWFERFLRLAVWIWFL